jgi:hypothetical protein
MKTSVRGQMHVSKAKPKSPKKLGSTAAAETAAAAGTAATAETVAANATVSSLG